MKYLVDDGDGEMAPTVEGPDWHDCDDQQILVTSTIDSTAQHKCFQTDSK